MTPASSRRAALVGAEDTATREEWEAAAAAVLRKAGRLGQDEPASAVWDRLATTTLDAITLPPLGTRTEEGAATATAWRDLLLAGDDRPEHKRDGWDVRAQVDGRGAAAQANREAVEELRTGASSLWLRLAPVCSPGDVATLLDGVLVDLAPVVLACPEAPVAAATAFLGWLEEAGSSAAAGTGLGADPVGAVLSGSAPAAGVGTTVTDLAGLARPAGVRALTVDATLLHDRGASDAQELGYSLAVGAAYLRLLTDHGLPVDEALGLVEFRYAATCDQLATIAKLRAARLAWARVAELSGASAPARAQRQHAVTGRPMMTRYDPWVNLLRTTVAGFAAGVAGADALTVLPFDSALGVPDAFGRRMARHISSVMLGESQLGRVRDPAGGAHAVERLTHDLAQVGWAELERIEAAGGVLAAMTDGSLAARVQGVAARRREQVARRTRRVTGVSEFPLSGEALLARPPRPRGDRPVTSYAADFEALRDAPEGEVLLVTMGSLADHSARLRFAENLFAAGGVASRSTAPAEDTKQALAAHSGEPVVCLVGSDAAYSEWGPALVAGLRKAGARHVILAGAPGERTLPAGLVDDHCALGTDAVAFLRRTREAAQ